MSNVFDRTLDVIAQIDKAETPETLCAALTRFTSRFGLVSMMAGTMPSKNVRGAAQRKHLLASGFPEEWMLRYLQEGYVHVDPVIARIKLDLAPFEWHEAMSEQILPISRRAELVMEEAKEFKLYAGFSVPTATVEGDIAAVSFGGHHVEMSPEHRGMISMASHFAIGKAFELRSRTSKRGEIHLTPRELECLKWVADGKTEWEIGEILGISEHTADKHLSNAHRKLSARNRPQAVANAIRLGFLS